MFLLVVLISAVGTFVGSSSGMAINSSEVDTVVVNSNFKDCFTSTGFGECFKSVALQTLNRAIESNVAIQVTRFLVIKKNPDYQPVEIEQRTPYISWGTVLARVRDFISSRTFQLSLTAPDGHSSLLPDLSGPEGRGKKHKHKQQGGMYMMGGVAFMAMVAQLVLGKVALLAAMALIMAKIALVFSTLNGFKKAASGGGGGGGGGGGDHGYVYEHHGSGGHGGGGWQRSIEPKKQGTSSGGGPDYYDEQAAPYRRRRPDYDYRDPLDGA